MSQCSIFHGNAYIWCGLHMTNSLYFYWISSWVLLPWLLGWLTLSSLQDYAQVRFDAYFKQKKLFSWTLRHWSAPCLFSNFYGPLQECQQFPKSYDINRSESPQRENSHFHVVYDQERRSAAVESRKTVIIFYLLFSSVGQFVFATLNFLGPVYVYVFSACEFDFDLDHWF